MNYNVVEASMFREMRRTLVPSGRHSIHVENVRLTRFVLLLLVKDALQSGFLKIRNRPLVGL